MFRFLFGRLYLSPDADGGGGGADAGAGAGDAGAGAPADTATLPSLAEQQQAATIDLLGGVPEGWTPGGVPRGTSEPNAGAAAGAGAEAGKEGEAGAGAAGAGAGAPAGDAGAAGAAGAGASAANTPPPFDFSKIAGGKYQTAEALEAAITAADAVSATLADPQLQAFVEMAKDPVKAADFFHDLRRDYAAEATANPYNFLLADFKASNPDYTDKEAEIAFKRKYNDEFPNIGIEDPDDEDYQESAILRDGAVRRVVTKLTAAQQERKDKLLAELPKLAPTAAAAGEPKPLATDEEIAAHDASVKQADTALTARTATVPVLDAQGNKVRDEALTLPVPTGETRENVNLLMQDAYAYFEKVGIADAQGNFNYANLQQFALRAVNHEADMQAALQRGIALGVQQGAAALINPNENPNQQPNQGQGAGGGAQGTQQKSGYWERKAQQAQNIPEY